MGRAERMKRRKERREREWEEAYEADRDREARRIPEPYRFEAPCCTNTTPTA
jgi:hypothetical protein